MASSSTPLTDEERDGVVIAAQSVFTKLRNLYKEIESTFFKYGFTPPSAGVIARDLSEKIEVAIAQHCSTFAKGAGHCDLQRHGYQWEVKICKGTGLTINQSKQIVGENYIVVNYTADTRVSSVWVLWEAQDSFFSQKKSNTNARSLLKGLAAENIEVICKAVTSSKALPSASTATPAKATLKAQRQSKAS